MKEFLEPHVIISLAVIVGSIAMVAITLIIVLRDKISAIYVSRTGVEIRTNDVQVNCMKVAPLNKIAMATEECPLGKWETNNVELGQQFLHSK